MRMFLLLCDIVGFTAGSWATHTTNADDDRFPLYLAIALVYGWLFFGDVAAALSVSTVFSTDPIRPLLARAPIPLGLLFNLLLRKKCAK